MTDDKQRYFVELQFNYSAPIYDGDPTNLDELAALEEFNLADALQEHLDEFFDDVDSLHVKVSAVHKIK